MDNQQKQSTLHPSQDFFIGQQVIYSGITGEVISTNYHSTHPILVDFGSEREAFTKEGCLYGEDVELFGLEESDKLEQPSEQDTDKAPSLQTFKHIAEWIAKTAQFVDGDWYVGKGFFLNALNIEELHLLYLLKGLEEGTTDVSVGK